MDELVKLVAQKTGIPEATAKIAVETVLGYIKQQLPPPLAAQVEAVISGKGLSPDALGDIAKGLGLGNLLGGNK